MQHLLLDTAGQLLHNAVSYLGLHYLVTSSDFFLQKVAGSAVFKKKFQQDAFTAKLPFKVSSMHLMGFS